MDPEAAEKKTQVKCGLLPRSAYLAVSWGRRAHPDAAQKWASTVQPSFAEGLPARFFVVLLSVGHRSLSTAPGDNKCQRARWAHKGQDVFGHALPAGEAARGDNVGQTARGVNLGHYVFLQAVLGGQSARRGNVGQTARVDNRGQRLQAWHPREWLAAQLSSCKSASIFCPRRAPGYSRS